MNKMDKMLNEIFLVYDKECPACDYYCQVIRLRESVGRLTIIDAREPSDLMDDITARGFDIDQGMVLIVGDQFYYGSDAIHTLALMGSRSGVFNRFNYWMFRSKTISNLVYPILKMLRNLLLKALGKTKVNNLSKPKNIKF